MSNRFDAIIIGAGQAGPPLAGRLSQSGKRVALIERKQFGGTCVNTGCIPTKTMVASAYAVHMVRRANDFGVKIQGSIQVDLKAVKARKDAVSGKSREGLEKWLRGMKNCSIFNESARFVSSHEIEVGSETIRSDQIFINVGSRAMVPRFPGVEEIPYLTNSSMLELEELPRHLVVIGGSYVGLEFAQMFRRFGSEVTVVEKGPRLILREDEDVSVSVKEILESEGICFRLGAECIALERSDQGISVHVSCTTGGPKVHGSHVLLAVGRIPNTDDLGLDKAGVQTDERGYIIVDDQLSTNISGIWALGDCNGRGAFTHTSYNDFEIVAANLLDDDPRRLSDRIQAHALYIDPPLGQIGLTEVEVRRTGKSALIATRPMTKVGRAVEKGETLGFMKILIDAESKEVLGAAILGTGGDEAIHCILDIMYSRRPYTTLQRAMHIHPTVSELIPTLLGDLHPLV